MKNQKSVINLIKQVWEKVLLQKKKSIFSLYVFLYLIYSIDFPQLLSKHPGFIVFAVIISVSVIGIFLQVASSYLILAKEDDLFLSNDFKKLFKESFLRLLGLQILKFLIFFASSLPCLLVFAALSKVFKLSGIISLISIGLVIALGIFCIGFAWAITVFAPYHIIFECGGPIWSFKRSIATFKKNNGIIIKLFLLEFLVLFLVSQSSFLRAILGTTISIIIDIIFAYLCLKEVKND